MPAVGTGEQVGGVGGEGRQGVVDGPVGGVCLDAARPAGPVPGEEGCGGHGRERLVHRVQGFLGRGGRVDAGGEQGADVAAQRAHP